ncbi:protein of unknown function [Klenkia soli]|uniref:DUF202 domain-containing protein n=1 Tax=Klenkia soli TaxID=1052260 RepID=A0A1H0PVL3_9ACTN|nr:DUF202 domain-containing protein [Klenkia soli]SDP09133.1 protein of unknown function [Klenkia soli]
MSAPPGLAPERTALAWTRTGLAAAANGALLLLRSVTGEASPAGRVLVVAAFAVAGVAVVLGQLRSRALLAGRRPGEGAPVVLGVLVAALCLATVVVVPALG